MIDGSLWSLNNSINNSLVLLKKNIDKILSDFNRTDKTNQTKFYNIKKKKKVLTKTFKCGKEGALM